MSSQDDSRRPSTGGNTAVKDLGRKARARLDEEKGKRREIVRLDATKLANPEAKKRGSGIGFVRPKKRQSNAASRKRKTLGASGTSTAAPSKRLSTGSSGSGRNKTVNNNVDVRVPDVSSILLQIQDKDALSNVVRVHGLPLDATRGDLLRFFAGLDPVQVFLLQQNNCKILHWDAEECSLSSSKAKNKVVLQRHPSSFRAFVKFANAPVAALASQRSGETLYLGKRNDEDHQSSQRMGANIAVTQVPKQVAKYLLRNMAIECRTTSPLDEELYACEAKLHALVPRIIWSAAMRDLRLQAGRSSDDEEDQLIDYEPIQDTKCTLLQDPSTTQGQAALTELHNTLVKDYEALTTGTPFPSVAACNSTELLADPSIRLTDTAAKHLQEKIQHLDSYLHMARNLLYRRRNGVQPSVFDSLVPKPRATETAAESEGSLL